MHDDVRLTKAREHARGGRYREAARLFAAHLANRPVSDSMQEQIELGFALLLAGDGDGARRIYDMLRSVITSVHDLPGHVARLWEQYSSLIAGARRHLVLASVTAVVMTASGCGGTGTSGSVDSSPTTSQQTEKPTEASSSHDHEGESRPEQPEDILKGQDILQPPSDRDGYSAHRYSGGVFLPTERRSPLKEE